MTYMIPNTISDIALVPEPLTVLLLAIAIDLILGEPPARVHPVVLIGRLIGGLKRRAPPSRAWGAAVALIVILSSAGAGHLLIAAGETGISTGVVGKKVVVK